MRNLPAIKIMFMERALKEYILKDEKLYKVAASFLNTVYLLTNSTNIKGKNNLIEIHQTVLQKKVKIDIKGINNKIIINPFVRLKNTIFEVFGDNNVIYLGKSIAVYENARFLIEGNNCNIHLDDKVTVGSADFFAGESNTSIYIGEDCMLSREIKFNTSDFHSIIDIKSNIRINLPADIDIGSHTWIGHGATISKGASIANNTVIAAHSLLNKKYTDPNVVIAGQPGKIVRTNINWDRRKLSIDK